ncbi:glycerate kinase [Sinanaerobacter chloroacetimidivorans]|jgi:glycerate kinase|uniref:Glycerate kinase n=1 Tax=Sinanaerobacter chloroacetimidivorans TaxID=2818044 RepID=A0A8J7W1I2_9FIRM|nr:glycerate kinase [Sinanaerobacter chloroacetimidivorans]MBR0597468.1 glycerate kinase [Sinanaerobacter chloroacetimidivorans]
MKIVLAPDTYKGSLTAMEACRAMETGIRRVDRDAEVVCVPMADGGEGTMQNILDAVGGMLVECDVLNPLGQNIVSRYAILKSNTAVIELAEAAGLYLIGQADRNPLKTTTYGVGQLIVDALDKGCRNFILAIGGSATNDGGAGMAQALGFRLLNADGKEIDFGGGALDQLCMINTDFVDSRIYESKFVAACDVSNPLCGPKGASRVFGPQKGATEQMVEVLDRNLAHYANILKTCLNADIADLPGSGAAGGIGGGMMAYLNAELNPGVDIVIDAARLREKMANADLVITGEGGCDFQTVHGKTPYGVSKVAQELNIPVIIIAGNIGKGAEALYEHGVTGIFSLTDGPVTLEYAMANGKELLASAAERILKCITYFMNTGNKNEGNCR